MSMMTMCRCEMCWKRLEKVGIFKNEEEEEKKKEREKRGICEKGMHEFEFVIGDGYACVKCGWMDLIYSFDYNDEEVGGGKKVRRVWPRKYIRSMYMDKKLESWVKPQVDFLVYGKRDILPRIKNPTTWKEIYDEFKSFPDRSLFPIILSWMGIGKVDFREEDKEVMETVDKYFEVWNEEFEWKMKKKFNIFYVIYKAIQMRGGRCELVPNKMALTTLKAYDKKWKRVCGDMQWKFVESEVEKIQWEKEKKLEELKSEGFYGCGEPYELNWNEQQLESFKKWVKEESEKQREAKRKREWWRE